MIAATYYIPDSLKAEIEARAEQEGRSASAMAVRLLREALGPKERPKAPEWADDVMEAFWRAYPRKTNKKKALDAMRSMIVKNPDIYFWYSVIDDVRARFSSIDNKKFIPHATTYLNGARWEDEVIHEDNRPAPKNAIRRIEEQAAAGFARAQAREADERFMAEDDAAIRPQVGFSGRRDTE